MGVPLYRCSVIANIDSDNDKTHPCYNYLGLIGCAMSLLARRIGAVIDKVYIIAHDNRLTIGILLPVLVITSELAAPYLSINSLWLHIPVIATALWIRHKLLSR